MPLQLDYFYGGEAEQFSFYRIPKVLFTKEEYRAVSIEAKLLYGLMLDRMSLSMKSGWVDEESRVYIIFALEEVMDLLGAGHNRCVKLYKELEDIGLIERKKRQGRPALVYVKNFVNADSRSDKPSVPPADGFDTNLGIPVWDAPEDGCCREGSPDFLKPEVQTSENRKSRLPETGSPDFPKSEVRLQTSENRKSGLPKIGSLDFRKSEVHYRKNNTDLNNTYLNDNPSIHPLLIPGPVAPANDLGDGWMDSMDSQRGAGVQQGGSVRGLRDEYLDLIRDNVGYDELTQERPYDLEIFDGYVELLADVCASRAPTVRIGGQDLPTEIVRSRFTKLDGAHIRYVMDAMKENTAPIRNIRGYTLTALYNAPITMGQYYCSQANSDLARDSPSAGRGYDHPGH